MRLDEFSIQADYYAETTLSCRSQRSAEHAGSANVTNSLTRALRHNGARGQLQARRWRRTLKNALRVHHGDVLVSSSNCSQKSLPTMMVIGKNLARRLSPIFRIDDHERLDDGC